MTDFVHLHTHSHYTLLESTNRVSDLVAMAQAQGAKALALTDRAVMTAACEFQGACQKAGIKPILGCQVNLAPLGRRERTRDMLQLVLLAMNDTGYSNLIQLVSRGFLEGFYYEARVDFELLKEYNEGLICLTGAGEHGYVNRHLQVGATEEADRQAELLREIFGDRLYIELTDHGDEGPVSVRAAALELARRLDIPPVATNWVHYASKDDADAHDVQLAVQKVTTLADPRRKRMPTQEFYLKTPEQMAELFADAPDAITNTVAIADRCEGGLVPMGTYHLPVFDCPNGMAEIDYLEQLAREGLPKRYGENITEELTERLEFELSVIRDMGFPGYFLIVSDFINWAKDNGIPVGPGRGSAAGSLVAYCLGITDICPMRYGLLFERFLNPGRKSMPDIDIDFCKDRRSDVIAYTAEKYGREAVTNIMTLGTMKARMAIKDVGRAYEWTPDESQALANLVPEDPSGKHTIPVCLGKKSLKGREFDPSDQMVLQYNSDPRTHDVLDTAMALENLGRSHGVHACGIIIAPGPVHNFVPVMTVKDKPATQYNMVQVEECGLLKMDFLGLKTMSILKKSADIVKMVDGIDIDFPTLDQGDMKTFGLLGEGRTLGVFQCESTGFQELIKLLKPDRLEDMIALVALYRPGPLMANMHIQYCDRKHGREAVEYPHPVLKDILEETFGLYIYQEQIMNISRELCGFTPSEADDLRKAMGKKKIEVLEKIKDNFVTGAWERHQFPKDQCETMWDKILGFASYCFNKSHSACYGLIAYWTAYMKANHYEAFMTANLIYEMGNKGKMTLFTQELNAQGVSVLPPDINESGWEFTWTGKAIRFGFGGIKGVGEGAAEHLIAVRNQGGAFTSLFDVCERIDTRKVNKRVIENLIKAGAFDSLHENRHAAVESIERAFHRAQRLAKNREDAQETLFSMFETDDSFRAQTQGLAEVGDWQEAERLRYEKELTGYWISGHPLREHMHRLEPHVTHNLKEVGEDPDAIMCIPGVIVAKRDMKTRKGSRMAILTCENEDGRFETVLFAGRADRRGHMVPGAYEKFAGECEEDMVALFVGKLSQRNRNSAPPPTSNDEASANGDPNANEDNNGPEQLPSIIIDEIVPLPLLEERLITEVRLTCAAEAIADEQLDQTYDLLRSAGTGSCRIRCLVSAPPGVLLTMDLGDEWSCHPTKATIDGLERIWGTEHFQTGWRDLTQQQRQRA
jgi:DNA polymerase-3 subunit alpha